MESNGEPRLKGKLPGLVAAAVLVLTMLVAVFSF